MRVPTGTRSMRCSRTAIAYSLPKRSRSWSNDTVRALPGVAGCIDARHLEHFGQVRRAIAAFRVAVLGRFGAGVRAHRDRGAAGRAPAIRGAPLAGPVRHLGAAPAVL